MDALKDSADEMMIDDPAEKVDEVAFVVPPTVRFGGSSLSLFARFALAAAARHDRK